MAKSRNSQLELIKGRWREFKREPSALFFVVLMPVLWMAILGFAFSGDGGVRYGVGWPSANDDSGLPEVLDVKEALKKDTRVKLYEGTMAELGTAQQRGKILVTVTPTKHSVRYQFDPGNPEAHSARLLVDDILQRASGRKDVKQVLEAPIDIPRSRYIDFLVPGLLALSIMTSSLFGTGMTIVSNRRENLLKRYIASPMKPYEYIVSHIVGRGFVLVVEVATILLAGFVLFRFTLAGNIIWFVAFAALGAAAFTALAILCGARTSNAAAMNGTTNLISLPMMIVSGVWFARDNFPDWIAEPVRFIPLTPLVDGLRRIALEGAGPGQLVSEMLILLGYLIACTAASRYLFRWY